MPSPEHAEIVRTDVIDVLVVEDEQRYAEFLVDVLGDMNCRARAVRSAADAQQSISERPPDVILLDLNLPVTDGMTFLQQFRRQDCSTPVVILTGVGDLPSAQQAIRLGVTEFLTKPCHLGQIEQAIDRARRRLVHDAPAVEPATADHTAGDGADVRPIAELERTAILAALRTCRGNRTAAAAQLGISRRTLYNRLEQYLRQGITPPGD